MPGAGMSAWAHPTSSLTPCRKLPRLAHPARPTARDAPPHRGRWNTVPVRQCATRVSSTTTSVPMRLTPGCRRQWAGADVDAKGRLPTLTCSKLILQHGPFMAGTVRSRRVRERTLAATKFERQLFNAMNSGSRPVGDIHCAEFIVAKLSLKQLCRCRSLGRMVRRRCSAARPCPPPWPATRWRPSAAGRAAAARRAMQTTPQRGPTKTEKSDACSLDHLVRVEQQTRRNIGSR